MNATKTLELFLDNLVGLGGYSSETDSLTMVTYREILDKHVSAIEATIARLERRGGGPRTAPEKPDRRAANPEPRLSRLEQWRNQCRMRALGEHNIGRDMRYQALCIAVTVANYTPGRCPDLNWTQPNFTVDLLAYACVAAMLGETIPDEVKTKIANAS